MIQSPTPKWKLMEAHDTAYRAVCTELGFFDTQGRIRRFDGPKFWPKFNALGHTKGEFELCACQSKRQG